jgi:hypothetical protein
MSAPFHDSTAPIAYSPDKPPSILQNAQTVIEHEMRRNIFWIGSFILVASGVVQPNTVSAYALERQQAAGNSFAMVLDDLDVYQLLPLRIDQYEQGVRRNCLTSDIPFV